VRSGLHLFVFSASVTTSMPGLATGSRGLWGGGCRALWVAAGAGGLDAPTGPYRLRLLAVSAGGRGVEQERGWCPLGTPKMLPPRKGPGMEHEPVTRQQHFILRVWQRNKRHSCKLTGSSQISQN
jgi:hypothetical protein